MSELMLSAAELRCWRNVGHAYLPGQGGLPSYRDTDATDHLPALLAAGDADDIASLRLVVRVLGSLPGPLSGWLVRTVAAVAHTRLPGSGLFRLLDMGLRGVIISSYYNGLDRDAEGQSKRYRTMDIHIHCRPD